MLSAHTRIGPYQILSLVGEGGMGEVYRARDTVLGREVAIKALPAAFSSDTERVARFQREAQALAALSHPHIASIYGFEQGVRALVMKRVEKPAIVKIRPGGQVKVPDFGPANAPAREGSDSDSALSPTHSRTLTIGSRAAFSDGCANRTGTGASDDGRMELDGRNQEVRSK